MFRVVSSLKLSNKRRTGTHYTHRVNPCVSYFYSVFAFALRTPWRWDSKQTQASPRHPRRRSQQRLRGHHRRRRHEMRRHKRRSHKRRSHVLRHRKLRHRKLHHDKPCRRRKLHRQPMISVWMRIEVLTLATRTILHTRGRLTLRVRLLPTRSFAVLHLR